MGAKSFRTTLESGFVELPFDVKRQFGKARPPVSVSINGYHYRSTVAVYGGKYYVPVRKDRREAAGVKVGDTVRVMIALDTEVRRVELPPELQDGLARNRLARERWERLSYTHQREHAEAILRAKKPGTRKRRVKQTLQSLVRKRIEARD